VQQELGGANILVNNAAPSYVDALAAPSTELVWFDESGHEPFVDEPAKFNAAMAELVWPVLSSGASSTGSRSGLSSGSATVIRYAERDVRP
jgi:hypothetical protein